MVWALGAVTIAAVGTAPVVADSTGADRAAGAGAAEADRAAYAAPVVAPTTAPPSSPPPSSPPPSTPPPSSPAADEESTGEPIPCENEAEPAQWNEQEPWAQDFLKFQQAWPYATGEGVTVAVLDTGLVENPQFAETSFAEEDARDFTSGEPAALAGWDCDGHGTSVTGIIAAGDSPYSGFVGVAPDATILPLRVSAQPSSGRGGLQKLADGIHWAVDHDADILNISLEAQVDFPALREAVAYAAQHKVLIVAASGNHGHEGDPTTYPAAYAADFPNVISVGAIDQTGHRAQFSGTSAVTVMAPGANIISTQPLQGNSEPVNGTSFAAPFVSGTAALLLDASGLQLTPAQIKRRIAASADPPPGGGVPDEAYGYGVLNVIAAVTGEFPKPTDRKSESKALTPLKPTPPPDHTMRNVAVSVTIGAVVLVLGVLAGVATARKGRTRDWRPGLSSNPSSAGD